MLFDASVSITVIQTPSRHTQLHNIYTDIIYIYTETYTKTRMYIHICDVYVYGIWIVSGIWYMVYGICICICIHVLCNRLIHMSNRQNYCNQYILSG